jgi:hypothetical protein
MKNIIKFLLVLIMVFSINSCTKDWLDVNDSPNSPTVPELRQLLTGGQRFMAYALGQGNFIGNNLSSYVHHLVSREVQNYGIAPNGNNILNTWNYFYLYVVKTFDAIIEDAGENVTYAGIAKTLKAYSFSMMADLWGDVPYSEYNIPGLLHPRPDGSAAVYNSVIALLEEAMADLTNTTASNLVKPGADDLIYGGNVTKWIRVNNTIKLKLLLQSRKAKSDITDWNSKFTTLMTANNFITNADDFQFWYGAQSASPDHRHPTFASDYGTGTTHWISPYFYEMMMGQTHNNTLNPFAGIQDPRVPYYFYNQLTATGTAQVNYEYRNGAFLSIFFASNSSNSASTQNSSQTKPGLYPCGGRFDHGTGGAVTTAAGNGNGVTALKFVTYNALQFMLAELALTGETSGNARDLFQGGMEAAIAHVNAVVGRNGGQSPAAPTIAAGVRDVFVADVLAKYDAAATNEEKLEIIMSQKWIANFFTPVETYNDYRRTGYPRLFNPANTSDPGFGVNLVVLGNSAARVPISVISPYPRSMYYPTSSEEDLNPNIIQKQDISAKVVFWDK